MSVKYLYYTESEATGGGLSAAHVVPLLDQELAMVGGSRMCIHPTDADYPATASESYHTLAAAQVAYPNYTWLYLDAEATQYLDELPPPVDDVVYVVGHDLMGYEGNSLNGERYKIRTLRTEPFQGHSIVMLTHAAIDRWVRMASWL